MRFICLNCSYSGMASAFASGCGAPVVPRARRSKKCFQSETKAVWTNSVAVSNGSTTRASCGLRPAATRFMYDFSAAILENIQFSIGVAEPSTTFLDKSRNW